MIAGLGAAGILAAGAGAGALAFGGAMTLGVGVAAATPEEDCAAVRARDHQIWLDMVAALPPGSPIPPEYVNPCIAEDPSYAPGANDPGISGGQTGQMGGGAGISPGTNAPTNLAPATPGGDIVPLPGQSPAPQHGSSAQGLDQVPGAPAPGESGTEVSPGPEREDRGDRDGQGRILAPAEVDTDDTRDVTTDPDAVFVQDADPASGDAGQMLLLLTGVAGGLAGASRFGRGSLSGGRWPWRTLAPAAVRPWESSLSQVVGTTLGPLMAYAPGGQSKITIDEPGGGQRTLFLIHDETSSHEAQIPVDVPEGGSMRVNDDGSVTVLDGGGAPVYVVDAPWAYDADGNAVDTDFVVRDGQLYQRVFANAETAYPILADPPGKKPTDPGFVGPVTMDQKAAQERNAAIAAAPKPAPTAQMKPTYPGFIGPVTPEQKAEQDANRRTQEAYMSKSNQPRRPDSQTPHQPRSAIEKKEKLQVLAITRDADQKIAKTQGPMLPKQDSERKAAQDRIDLYDETLRDLYRTTPRPVISPAQQAANQLALAHAEVPPGYVGNVPMTIEQQEQDLNWRIEQARKAGWSDDRIVSELDDTSTALGASAAALENAVRSNPSYAHSKSPLMNPSQVDIAKTLGKGLSRSGTIASILSTGYQLTHGGPFWETSGEGLGTWGGAWAGGKSGALVGSPFGPVAAISLGILGAVGMGIAGGWAGKSLGKLLD